MTLRVCVRHRNGEPNPARDDGRANGGGHARSGGQYGASDLEYTDFYVPSSATGTGHSRSWAGVPRGSCDVPVDSQQSAVRCEGGLLISSMRLVVTSLNMCNGEEGALL